MAACAGLFSACSNDLIDEVNPGNETTDGTKDAYASVSFVMPSSGLTRATPTSGQNGDGSEIGTSTENNFNDVRILLFKDGVLLTEYTELEKGDFEETIGTNKELIYTTKKDINVASGTYKVYVVLNPTDHFKVELNSTTLTAFQAMEEYATIGKGEYCRDNQFMMTNADPIEDTVIKQENISGNAKAITVHVERVAAKISYTQKEESYDFTDTYGNKISVTFDAFKVINTRNSAYNLRRVGMDEFDVAIGGKETGENYVIENKWADKKSYTDEVFTANYSRRAADTYVAFRKLTTDPKENQTLAYCMENTMLSTMQINGYSTGIIFRAKATVNDETGDLYKYEGKFYTSLIKLAQSADPQWDGTDNPDALKKLNYDILKIKSRGEGVSVENYLASINDRAILHNDFNVDFFVGGYCYYTYWLRHANNNDENTMGIMEFAIVRNNVYKVRINSVAAMGDFTSGTKGEDPKNPGEVDNPDPENPNPEMPGVVVPDPEPTDPVVPVVPTDPDETNETYLNVTIDVNPWIIRANDIDFK